MPPDTPIRIRPETREDAAAITVINDAAFGQANEGRLIEALRSAEAFDPELSLVAETTEGAIVGHILFTPVQIVGDEKTFKSLALAPMAVLPNFQNQGIGSQLVEAGLASCRVTGHDSVIVLGHPQFYPRFGFKPASRFGILCPFEGVPDPAFMAMELMGGALRDKAGIIEYPPAFSEA